MTNKLRFCYFIGLIILVSGSLAFGQDKRLTIEDASYMSPRLNPANLSQLQWIPGTGEFVFVVGNSLVKGSVTSPVNDTLLRLTHINRLLKGLNEDTLKRYPQITMESGGIYTFSSGNALFQGDLAGQSLKKINSWVKEAENQDIDRNNHRVAYTRENNLFISENGREIAVTQELNKGIVYGSERVHRNEFGIDKGTFWSPTGNYLAFYRMDERRVTDYPLVDISPTPAAFVPVKYPMAGMTSHKVTVGVYTPSTGKIVYLDTRIAGGSDSIEYLTNVTWSPDEKYIYIACLNRDQNHLWLNRYDAANGRLIKTLFEETHPAYVEPLHGPRFLQENPEFFIWESRRDGFNHLYLYETSGKLIRQLTSGPWEVMELTVGDREGKVFFTGNKEHPLRCQGYSVEISTGKLHPLTPAPGTHLMKVSSDGRYLIDSWSSLTTGRVIRLADNTGKELKELLRDDNPLKDYQMGKTTVFALPNEENTDLWCRLIKPVAFDSTKKYPVIIYVYGGPHSQMVTDSWLGGGGLFLNYLASQGYMVFTLDNRGTSNRGRDFEQAIFRHLGDKELADQMTGVRFLKSLPYVDTTRIGINGWSYGGFMTITMMLREPGTFKAASCGGPVIDWKYYEVMYGERYMDTPEQNPEGYQKASLLNQVKNLRGRLLIIHDYQDGTVVPQNSLMFLKKCVDEGKQVDYFIYPGHEHNVRGKDRVHLNQKMVQYFQDYL